MKVIHSNYDPTRTHKACKNHELWYKIKLLSGFAMIAICYYEQNETAKRAEAKL